MIPAGRSAPAERRTWGLAAGIALAAHAGVAALVIGWSRPALPPLPEPVVLVELPADVGLAASLPSAAAAEVAASHQPAAASPAAAPAAPPAPLPLLQEPVTLPLPVAAPMPLAAPARPVVAAPPSAASQPAALRQPAPAASGAGSSAQTAGDPRAHKAEVDYFSLVSAYLNRRKTYPVEARQARAEGVVTLRFTVGRDGTVSGAAIKRSSGHALLDQATLALLARVAPLPRMPAAMVRDSVTLALPIEYSLKTS